MQLQGALSVVAPIRGDGAAQWKDNSSPAAAEIARVAADLAAHRAGNSPAAARCAWWRMSRVHYARLMIMPESIPRRIPPSVVLSTNYDGPLDAHLSELLEHGGDALHRVFERCVGYPGRAGLADYLVQQDHGYGAFHVAKRWYSVGDIQREEALRQHVQELLDARRSWLGTDVHAELRRELQADPAWSWAVTEEPPSVTQEWRRRHVLGLAGEAVVGGAGIVAASLGLPLLLIRELYDSWQVERRRRSALQWRERMREINSIARFAGQEDAGPVNQLSIVSDMRGPPHTLALRSVFFVIEWLARAYYYRGFLGGISTIHFARWVHVDKGSLPWSHRRLLFMSNYDGSWESYLGDFVDQEATGLTGVWSNTAGFPTTHLLAFIGGARDEQAFKRWARKQQFETGVWYAAYPDLTVQNVIDNSRLRRGLYAEQLSAELRDKWLRLL